jgi:hypothetical protein
MTTVSNTGTDMAASMAPARCVGRYVTMVRYSTVCSGWRR